jgi:SAM-dependent methyltransferase
VTRAHAATGQVGRAAAGALIPGVSCGGVQPDERWLVAVWPFVRAQLPAPRFPVLEIGCGPLGGFVPMLRDEGYQAIGIDPEAPDGPWFGQVEFERYALAEPVGAVVACTSLHHVADLGQVLDLVDAALLPGGLLVIAEWATERFDQATARWCFERLPMASADHGWLQRRRDEWRDSGQSWDAYCRSWAEHEGLHAGQDILRELGVRFHGQSLVYGPYFFPDLAGVSEDDEQAAIDAGQIRANRFEYVGRRLENRTGRQG